MSGSWPRSAVLGGVVVSVLVGLVIGLGGFTFVYARGASYMTDDPAACANCHVMNEQLTSWRKSSHHAVAVCNDCHTPHTSIFAKYFTKALNGWHHSSAFTTGNFPEPIRITERNLEIAEAQCRRCHEQITSEIAGPHAGGAELSCVRCHASVGHLEGQ